MSGGAHNSKLAKRLRRRDLKALRQLVDDNTRLLWAVASGHLPRFAGFTDRDVEECVSDAFMSFAQHPERYDEQRGTLQAYLCALVRNRAIDRFRASGYRPEEYFDENALAELYELGGSCAQSASGSAARISADGSPVDDTHDARIWRGIDYEDLYAAVNALPDPTREVVVRRYFMEQKPAAIACAMGLPKKEVENRLYRAKRSLAKTLGTPESRGCEEEMVERKEADDE